MNTTRIGTLILETPKLAEYLKKKQKKKHGIMFYPIQNRPIMSHGRYSYIKGVLHPWALFLKTLCIFVKNKATLDKLTNGSGQKCSVKLKNHSFPSVETIVVTLQ